MRLSGTTVRLYFCPTRLVPLRQAPACHSPEMLRWSTGRLTGAATGQQFHWGLFAPRFGLAYRLNEQSVVRGGYGIFYVPDDASFNDAPWTSPINAASTPWLASLNGGATPNATLSSPFPSGILNPVGRSAGYQSTLYGTTMTLPVPKGSYGYTQQYNLNFEHDLGHGAMFGIAYAGSRKPPPWKFSDVTSFQIRIWHWAHSYRRRVPNPLFGLVPNGTIL